MADPEKHTALLNPKINYFFFTVHSGLPAASNYTVRQLKAVLHADCRHDMASQNVLDICLTCLLFCVARARAENFELEPEPNFWIGPSPRRRKTMSITSVFTKIVEQLIYEGWQIFYFLFLNFTAHAVNKLFNLHLSI